MQRDPLRRASDGWARTRDPCTTNSIAFRLATSLWIGAAKDLVRDDRQSKGLRVAQLLFEIERGDHGAGLNRACGGRGGHLLRLEGSRVRFLVGLLARQGGAFAEIRTEGLLDMFGHAFVGEGQIAFDMTVVDGGLKVADGIAGLRWDRGCDDGGTFGALSRPWGRLGRCL